MFTSKNKKTNLLNQDEKKSNKDLPLLKRIGVKILLCACIGIIAVGVISVTFITMSYKGLIDEINQKISNSAMITLESTLSSFKLNSMSTAMCIASESKVIPAIESRNTSNLKEIVNGVIKSKGLIIDFVTITDANGKVLFRTNSENIGDSIKDQKNIEIALRGERATIISTGTDVPLSLSTTIPLKNMSGKISGVVSAGFSLVKTDFIDELKTSTGNEFTIFIGDKRVNTSIIRNGERAVGTTLDPKIAKIVLEEQKEFSGQTDILSVNYSVSYKPIIDTEGNSIGVLFAGVPLKELMAVKNTIIFSSIIIVLSIVIIIILVLIRVVIKK